MTQIVLETISINESRKTKILSCILVFVFGFLPIWYFTTRVYRANLPFDQINEWNNIQSLDFKVELPISLVLTGKLNTFDCHELVEKTRTMSAFKKRSSVDLEFNLSCMHLNRELELQSKSLQEQHDELVTHVQVTSDYSFVLDCGLKNQIYIGKNRLGFMTLKDCTLDEIASSVSLLIQSLFIQEQSHIHNLLQKENPQKSDLKVLKYSDSYQVIFSLMNGNTAQTVLGWDIKEALDTYFAPFVEAISPITGLNLQSQIQNYADLPVQEEIMLLDGMQVHVLKPFMLPHFINSAEWNLAPAVSSSPPIHFVLYIPNESKSPLYLAQDDNVLSNTNSFLVPGWGGISVVNIPKIHSSIHHLGVRELKYVLEIYLYQLRQLLGIQNTMIPSTVFPDFEIQIDLDSDVGITKWEMDRLARVKSIQNILNSISTLNSIATLITRLENMVVLDRIQVQVMESLENLQKAREALKRNDLNNASLYSQKAILSSENAFFDKTMVSLLYFPSEHIYAMYMPYCIPVAIPIFMALKEWINKKRNDFKIKRD